MGEHLYTKLNIPVGDVGYFLREHLYTFSHTVQVFILGFIGGFFAGGLIISKFKWGRATEKKIVIRPIQRKIPSVTSTEYPIVSCKNY